MKMHARINRRRTRAVAVLAIALVTALPAQALASTITGTVKEWAAEGGGPMLGNVKVEVFDAGDIWTDGTLTSYGSAITAADGTYTITGLPNDTVVIVAFADTTGTHRDMVWPGTGKPVEWSPYGLMTGSEDASETSNVDGYLMTLGDLFANRTSRVAGVDRYETAVRISQYYFGSADTVVIASGASFADALSASTLAGAYGAPLLLTSKSTLPDVVGDEIEALGATKAYIIGGTGVVDAGCAAQIAARGVTIQRIAGNNRYHTGELVIRELPMEYIEDGTVALVARGDAFADALSASPFAYYDGFPILLTQPGALPTESQRAWQYLVDHGTDMAFVIGGTSAVSDNVIAQMDSRVPGGLYGDRLEGSDRYGTASVVADFFSGWFGPYDFMGLASGANYPDALAGGAGVGAWGGTLVLTPPTSLHAEADYTLWANGPYDLDLACFGGTGAVSNATFQAAIAALGTDIYDIDDPEGFITLTSTSVSPIALTNKVLSSGLRMANTPRTATPRLREKIDVSDVKAKVGAFTH